MKGWQYFHVLFNFVEKNMKEKSEKVTIKIFITGQQQLKTHLYKDTSTENGTKWINDNDRKYYTSVSYKI